MLRRLTLIAVAAAALLAALSPAAALARSRDSNHDRISDKWERTHRLSLRVDQSRRDQDRDGLKNLSEFKHGTNPRDADSDNDGLDDGDEVRGGNDPRDRDSDDDGVKDGEENAGTVASFDGTTLTITLAGGGTIAGTVDSTTEIKCRTAPVATKSSGGGGGSDDPAGDDHGGHGSDDPAGDDNGTHPAGTDDHGTDATTADDHGDNSGPGNAGDDDNGDDAGNAANCGTAQLTPGAVVNEAELETVAGKAVFHEVKLRLAA